RPLSIVHCANVANVPDRRLILEFAGRRGLRTGGCVRASAGDGTFELSPIGAAARRMALSTSGRRFLTNSEFGRAKASPYHRRVNIEDIQGISDVYSHKLRAAGIVTSESLLERGGKRIEREKLAQETGINEALILKWVNRADLMRVKGIGSEYSDLL